MGEVDVLVEVDGGVKLRLDAQGRWLHFRDATGFYRRALDGGVVRTDHPGEDVAEPGTLHNRVRQEAQQLAERLVHGTDETVGFAGPEQRATVAAWLERAGQWTAERFAELAGAFAAAYPEPVPILPPDRALDIVLLPALGCPWARCTFCAFYQDRHYRVLSEEEFAQHLGRVKSLLGPTQVSREGIFLGSANALALSHRRLTSVLGQAMRELGARRRGIGAFWDPDHSPRRDRASWESLVQAGLTTAYAGLETGHPELRERLGKHPRVDTFTAAVQAARAGGVRMGLMVLAGITGSDSALRAEHHQRTCAAVTAMGLDAGDLVFVSPYDSAEPAWARQDARELMRALRAATPARVAPYAMDRFRYYA